MTANGEQKTVSSKKPGSKPTLIRIVVGLLLTLLLVTVSVVEPQQPKKITRIGYLSPFDPARESIRSDAIRLALRELGYIEGQNIATEYRYAQGKADRYPELAAELARLKVDIILTGGDPLIRAAKNATKTIPIVMTGAGSDPVKAGLIDALDRPGGNVTGITLFYRELGGKRLELLKEAVPKLARVAVLYEPANPAGVVEVKEDLPVAARALRLTLQLSEIRTADDFDSLVAAINKQSSDGLYVPAGGALINANLKRIAAFALKGRLPAMYYSSLAVDVDGLMSYGADLEESYRRVAIYVDRILKGAKPAELPVEQPTKFELVINLKTAKQLGLVIPQNVLARADKVIR
jgi:putative tryptophan/tyrosine transport system substrate-binding protein